MKPWMNNTLTNKERAKLLLKEMTIQEKAGQMNQIMNIAPEHSDEVKKGNVGSSLFASGIFAGNIRDKGIHLKNLNTMQKIAVEESRLGIPILFSRDVIHGYRTIFPIPLAQGATWDEETVREGAAIAAKEASSHGLKQTFTPMLDIARDPRWGRIAEGYGEDPLLTGKLGAAAIKGFQGDPDKPEELSSAYKIAATAKHYVAYGAAEGGRDYNTVDIGERSLRDTYLPPFKAAVDAGAATFMSSFNDIDGLPVTANEHVLRDILKGEFGFEGFVVTDWEAIHELIEHGVAADLKEASVLAAEAGIDMDMKSDGFIQFIPELVESGQLKSEIIDEAVARILEVKFRLGLFDSPYTDESRAENEILTLEHRDAARRAAEKSFVLLKNENNILPLTPEKLKDQSLMLTGPFLHARHELFGTWTLDGLPEDVTTIWDAFSSEMKNQNVDGLNLMEGSNFSDFTIGFSRDADTVIAVIGEHPGRSGENNCVSHVDLPPGQLEVLKGIKEMGCKLIVVVFAGRPLAISWLLENADAVVYAWHPGTEGGAAISNFLTGKVQPWGRTTVTFPRTTGQVPIYYNYKPTGRPQDPDNRKLSRYNDLQATPLLPFGFGLCYTEFAYSDLQLSSDTLNEKEELQISVKVRNTGDVEGSEVVQLYLRDLVGSVSRPVKELKGYQRINLQPGEERKLLFTISSNDLAFTRRDFNLGTEPGKYKLWVGPNSQDGLEADFTLV